MLALRDAPWLCHRGQQNGCITCVTCVTCITFVTCAATSIGLIKHYTIYEHNMFWPNWWDHLHDVIDLAPTNLILNNARKYKMYVLKNLVITSTRNVTTPRNYSCLDPPPDAHTTVIGMEQFCLKSPPIVSLRNHATKYVLLECSLL